MADSTPPYNPESAEPSAPRAWDETEPAGRETWGPEARAAQQARQDGTARALASSAQADVAQAGAWTLTGALGGMALGLTVGGPLGAVVGGAAGAWGGNVRDVTGKTLARIFSELSEEEKEALLGAPGANVLTATTNAPREGVPGLTDGDLDEVRLLLVPDSCCCCCRRCCC